MLAGLPAGDKKRKIAAGGSAPAGGEEEKMSTVVAKGVDIALSAVRKLENATEDAYLVPNPESVPVTTDIMKAKEIYQNNNHGGKHAWGPERWLLWMTMSEHLCLEMKKNAVKFSEIEAFDKDAALYVEGILKMAKLVQENPAENLPMLKSVVAFMSAKKAKDGRLLIRISTKHGRLSAPWPKTVGLHGRRPSDMNDILVAGLLGLYNIEQEDGPAPRGPVERKLQNYLKTKK